MRPVFLFLFMFTEEGVEFLAGVSGDDFAEPVDARFLVFGGEDFYDIAIFKRSIELDHLAVDLGAGGFTADFAVETEGKIERHGADGQVENIAFWRVDENFIREEVEFELVDVDFFAVGETGG